MYRVEAIVASGFRRRREVTQLLMVKTNPELLTLQNVCPTTGVVIIMQVILFVEKQWSYVTTGYLSAFP